MTPRPPQIRWRKVIQEYPCETCGAGPGDPCQTYSGVVKGEPHAPRSLMARIDQWAGPQW